ncbi:MAG: T9SS type A sorting domain-containing protein [Crocinitomicaceae bacterium]|nr:T9SS type A sorting domain-containing protein [Crocinitomicaceae bacterium]MCF8445053.1 T9SS type A sorting domain-containing protein [Crocinitomicaceae bacterium]
MKKKFVTAFIASFLAFGFFGQGPAIEWQKCLGGVYGDTVQINDTTVYYSSGEDLIQKIIKTNDGGYIVVGTTGSNNTDVSGNHGLMDIWVVKLNSTGIIQWQKCYGGSYNEYGSDIQQTSDGGYIVCGWTNSIDGDVLGFHGSPAWENYPYNDYFILKISNSGSIQWKKCLGGNRDEKAYAIKQTTDGGYIVAGETNTNNNGDVTGYNTNNLNTSDAWVVKLTSSGNIDWKKCYGDSKLDYFNSVEILNDGSFYFSGTTDSYQTVGSHGQYDFWVVKTDGFGNTQWQKFYGGSARDYGNSLKITPDQGFVFTGETYSYNGDVLGSNNIDNGHNDVWVFRADNLGNILWQNSLGGTISEGGNDVVVTADGGYAVTGYTNSFNGDVSYNYGYKDFWIVKLNSAGSKTWEKCYGGVYDDISNSIVETTDGGFVLAGSIESNDFNSTISGSYGNGDGWVVKLGYYNGLQENNQTSFSVYPNPTTDKITIRKDNGITEEEFVLFDQLGNELLRIIPLNGISEIDLSHLTTGIYFLNVEGQNQSVKIVKN